MEASADVAWLAREVGPLVGPASVSSSCWSWCVTQGLRVTRESSRADLLPSLDGGNELGCLGGQQPAQVHGEHHLQR